MHDQPVAMALTETPFVSSQSSFIQDLSGGGGGRWRGTPVICGWNGGYEKGVCPLSKTLVVNYHTITVSIWINLWLRIGNSLWNNQ